MMVREQVRLFEEKKRDNFPGQRMAVCALTLIVLAAAISIALVSCDHLPVPAHAGYWAGGVTSAIHPYYRARIKEAPANAVIVVVCLMAAVVIALFMRAH